MLLKEKVIIVNLHTSQWTARKFDPDATEEINENHGASGAARVTKKLLDSKEFDAIGRIANSARRYHNKMTLPWDDKGPRILPITEYFNYKKEMDTFNMKYEEAIATFIPLYKDEVKSWKKNMGTFFKKEDYPSESELKDKFDMRYKFTPISDGSDLRVSLSKDEMKSIKKNIEESLQDKIDSAKNDIKERAKKVVQAMYDKLSEKDGTFRDSLVYNVQAVIEFIPSLNFDNDESINEMAKKLKKLCVKPEKLRTNAKIKTKIRKKAKKLLKEL